MNVPKKRSLTSPQKKSTLKNTSIFKTLREEKAPVLPEINSHLIQSDGLSPSSSF